VITAAKPLRWPAMSAIGRRFEQVVSAAADRWGRLDGLINNAGMSPLAPSLLETSEALFDKIVGVNLKGPTRLTALAAQAMTATGGGSIVNISSLASVKPTPTATTYSAAKGRSERTDPSRRPRVRGRRDTSQRHHLRHLRHDAAAGFVRNPDLLPEVVRLIALGRVGRPEEVVGAAVYLLSDASATPPDR